MIIHELYLPKKPVQSFIDWLWLIFCSLMSKHFQFARNKMTCHLHETLVRKINDYII